MNSKKKLCSSGLLYALINVNGNQANDKAAELARALAGSNADLIQLRAKKINDYSFFALAKEISFLFAKTNKLFIVNDRPDIALLANADGVHLGSGDLPAKETKRLIGKQMILGKTIHSISELNNTCQDCLDYLSLGPFFASETKINNRGRLKKNEIKQMLARTKKVTFAIGGINRYNIETVLGRGVKNIALSSALAKSPNPAKEANEIKKCLRKVS